MRLRQQQWMEEACSKVVLVVAGRPIVLLFRMLLENQC